MQKKRGVFNVPKIAGLFFVKKISSGEKKAHGRSVQGSHYIESGTPYAHLFVHWSRKGEPPGKKFGRGV